MSWKIQDFLRRGAREAHSHLIQRSNPKLWSEALIQSFDLKLRSEPMIRLSDPKLRSLEEIWRDILDGSRDVAFTCEKRKMSNCCLMSRCPLCHVSRHVTWCVMSLGTTGGAMAMAMAWYRNLSRATGRDLLACSIQFQNDRTNSGTKLQTAKRARAREAIHTVENFKKNEKRVVKRI